MAPPPWTREAMMMDDGDDKVTVNPFWCVAGAMRLVRVRLSWIPPKAVLNYVHCFMFRTAMGTRRY